MKSRGATSNAVAVMANLDKKSRRPASEGRAVARVARSNSLVICV
jgi:hypothetical protein